MRRACTLASRMRPDTKCFYRTNHACSAVCRPCRKRVDTEFLGLMETCLLQFVPLQARAGYRTGKPALRGFLAMLRFELHFVIKLDKRIPKTVEQLQPS